MSASTEQRKLAAIMFTDMVGYSALAQRNEKLALELLEEHRRLLREFFPRFGGREVETTGDGFLVEFASALEAARCAIEIQRALATRNLSVTPERQFHVRIGIHVGDVVHKDGHVLGDGVNIAARLQPLAEPGGICISVDVERQIRNTIEASLVRLGATELKNIKAPMELFRVVLPWDKCELDPLSHGMSVRRARRSRGLVVAAVSLVIISAMVWFWVPRRATVISPIGGANRTTAQKAAAPGRLEWLMVLPLRNNSGDTNQEFFVDGMTELLSGELGHISGLQVKSHTTAMRYKGTLKSMPEIARELNVDAVVEGSVLREGNQVLISIRLIEVATDRQLLAEKFQRDLTDALKMQSEVAEAIARKIQARLTPQDQARLASARSVNPAALHEYLLGRHFWFRGTEDGFRQAMERFNRAKEIDQNFALAWAGVADAYWASGDGFLAPTNAAAKAKMAAQRALELDYSLAEAHTTLAAMKFNVEFQWEDAEQGLQRAIDLNPSYATAHWQYAWLLAMLGRQDEALIHMQRAAELDPLSPIIAVDGNVPYTLTEQYDQAIAQCRKGLELDPNFYLAHFVLGWIELRRGPDFSRAIAELSQARAVEPAPYITGWLGYAYAKNGQKVEASKLLAELDRLATTRFVSPFCQALIYLGLGENDKAIDWFEKAYEGRSPWLTWLKVERLFDPLRPNPRFRQLIKKVGLDK